MSNITVIDELLVLLDDGKKITLDECCQLLSNRTRQTLSSTLGRLEAKGWIDIKRNKSTRIHIYSISKEGQIAVTNTLRHLKISDDDSWDKRWLFVIFNIPERERKYRDFLRNKLINTGFGRIQNSLWACARDVLFELESIVKNPKISQYITVIKPEFDDKEQKELVKSFEYDWKSPNKGYELFIKSAQKFLDDKIKNQFLAKLLVYEYAKLLSCDPKLPTFLEPTGYLRSRAHQHYLNIRPHCY